MKRHYPTPPIVLNGLALTHYKLLIQQLDHVDDFKVHKASNLARLMARRDKNTADEIELSIIKAEAAKLGVQV